MSVQQQQQHLLGLVSARHAMHERVAVHPDREGKASHHHLPQIAQSATVTVKVVQSHGAKPFAAAPIEASSCFNDTVCLLCI